MVAGKIGAVAFAVLLLGSSAASAQQRHPRGVNAREHHQVARIRQGAQGGELTRGELDRLKADQAAVRAEERVYRQSGDGLNRRERLDLEHDLNHTSREIYRAKHNNRKPQSPSAQ